MAVRYSDSKEIQIFGKTLIIRQRTLADILALERLSERYSQNSTGTAILLAAKLRDALKADNKRHGVLPITLRYVLKQFSLNQMLELSKQIDDLEGYGQKKKTETVTAKQA
jgi:hypothetical protein